MNAIDNIVSFFNPMAGVRRVQQRTALELVKRGYDAAKRSKKDSGWKIIDDTINSINEIDELRKRSRNLYQNNPYAKSAHRSIKNNTIGTGILPAITDEKVKEVWKQWAESINADFDENFNFYGLQTLATNTLSVQGNVFALRVKTKDKNGIPLEVKIVTSNFLDKTKDSESISGGGCIKGGIEYFGNGKRKGYWVYDMDPTRGNAKSFFWKKDDVIHLFEVEEPGQILGVPNGVTSILSLRDFDDYASAQLVKQKIAACFSVFITDDATNGGGSSTNDDNFERVEPGMIEHLSPGKQVTFAAPPQVDGYGDYSRNVLTGVSSGFGVTYEAMTGDLSNVNFSSGRMGWLESGRNIEYLQWFIIIPKFCQKVWEWFVDAGILSGKLQKDTPTKVEWTAPRRQMIDPVKETNGLLAQVRAGFMSWQEAVRSLGYTPEEIIEEMKKAKQIFDTADLAPECDPRYDVKTPYNVPTEAETQKKK